MTSTATKSHNGNPRSSTFMLLVLPAHRRDYTTNTGGDADEEYEEDPCKSPDYDADQFPAEQRQRQVSRWRDPHRAFTSSLRHITGRNLGDRRNVPVTSENDRKHCNTEDASRVEHVRKCRTPARYRVPGERIRTGPVRRGKVPRARSYD